MDLSAGDPDSGARRLARRSDDNHRQDLSSRQDVNVDDGDDDDEADNDSDNDDGPDNDDADAQSADNELTLERRRRTARPQAKPSAGKTAPLFCPQVDCPPEEQLRLENDCCTYCRNFNFCSNHHLAHWPPGSASVGRCHPRATCSLLDWGSLVNNSAAAALRPIEAMFECRCHSGFEGDGRRECRDIDECRDWRLNDCDPRSTRCVNLDGGYQCKCKPGFRPARLEGEPARPQVVAGEPQVWQRCLDVDECQDGKLNRCHPQARCVNLIGSYKCHCKRGYLGNGFECHKWFSSDPNVAAYLHRHSDEGQLLNESAASLLVLEHPAGKQVLDSQATTSARLRKVSLPLNTLDDDDDDNDGDDEQDVDRSELQPLPVERADAQDEDEHDGDQVPNLSESRWAPLRFELATTATTTEPGSQQVSAGRGGAVKLKLGRERRSLSWRRHGNRLDHKEQTSEPTPGSSFRPGALMRYARLGLAWI